MNLGLDNLPVNAFDFALLAILVIGVLQGRKHGMSEELLAMIKWAAILVGCAFLYEPAGNLFAQSTSMFSHLTCYLIVYITAAVLIFVGFAGIKRGLGGKLVGSDIFGGAEYYLGMASGLVRFTCILLVGLALLNARYFSQAEVDAMAASRKEIYGSDFFPGLHSLQSVVFERSLTGPWIRKGLGFLLIKPTEPENKDFKQKEYELPK